LPDLWISRANIGADAQPAPLRDIGLNDPQHVITQRLLETCAARDIFAGRERQAGAFAQALPFLPGPVGADRFFEPCKTKLGKMRRDLQCTFRRPGLVSVRRQHAISDELVKRGQVSAVGGKVETDFQLQRAMSSAQGSFRHLPRARRINAAGIDPDLVAVTAQHLPQRHVAATRVQIPNREIDPCDRLRKGTELAGLQREYRGALCQGVEDIRRLVRSKS
jgi:hypothetical protein